MKLYCATTNPGKLREFRLAAERFGAGWCDVEPVPGLKTLPACEEDGATFEENAVKKALHFAAYADGYVFADDSGLVVDALNGAPGIYSARFAGVGASDADNNNLLLEKMRGATQRAARFICVVAVARGERIDKTFTGVVEGVLLDEPRGEGGFGYDPLFFYPPFGCTLAEVDPDRKLSVSHRGKALAQMFQHLAP